MKPQHPLGKIIKEALQKRGLSQVNLEQISGIDQSQISRICAGDFRKAKGNVARICKILDVQITIADQRADQKLMIAIYEFSKFNRNLSKRKSSALAKIVRCLKALAED